MPIGTEAALREKAIENIYTGKFDHDSVIIN